MKKKITIFCLTLIIILLVFPTGIAQNIKIPGSPNLFSTNGEIPFILPEKGGGMAHCDQKMSDFINMAIPEKDINIV